jgi:hypothetical protein
MAINLIFQRLGGGKTLLMTLLLIIEKAKGERIFSNYETAVTDFTVRCLDDLLKIRHGVFGWDDAYADLSSREFKKNDLSNLMCRLSRKRELKMYMTTVRTMNIDINIRYNVDKVYMPQLIRFKDGTPFFLIVRQFDFFPEMKEGEDLLYRRKFFVKYPFLKLAMDSYDTEEEIYRLE